MHLLAFSLLSLLPTFSLASPVAEALAAPFPQATPTGQLPPKSQVYIKSVTWAGSGCHMGQNLDTAYIFSTDLKTITLIYGNYIASTGPGQTDITLSRRNCVIDIQVNVPNNWVFTISTTIFRGFQQLGYSCQGTISATYFFSGFANEVEASTTIYGNKRGYAPGDYSQTENVLAFWPPCNEPTMLNIDSAVSVYCSSKQDAAQLTVDSTDQKFTQVFQLSWRSCNGRS